MRRRFRYRRAVVVVVASSEAATERTGSGTFGGRHGTTYANLTSRVTECFTIYI